MHVEPTLSVERSSIGSGPGPMERGEDTPKLAAHKGPGSSAYPNVLNRVAWAGGWQSKDRGSRAPQRTLSRLLPSQAVVYPQLSAYATYSGHFIGKSPVQVQYTSVLSVFAHFVGCGSFFARLAHEVRQEHRNSLLAYSSQAQKCRAVQK